MPGRQASKAWQEKESAIIFPSFTEVLIVGAGPTGLTLAAALKQLGVSAVVIDKHAQGANTSRAAVVHARTLEVLDKLDVTPRLLRVGRKVSTFRVRDRDRTLLDIGFGKLDTPYPFTLMCPQDVTEGILRERLSELGVGVHRPVELRSLRRDGACLHADVLVDGEEAAIRANWVVGCDGVHGVTRTMAGIPFEGGTYREEFVLADVRMHWPLSVDEVDLFLSAAGLMVVAPLPGAHFRVVATVDRPPTTIDRDFLQDLLDRRGPRRAPARIDEVVWQSSFHVEHRLTATPRSGRILLCGDAAHAHSPAGGQGMNTGIQDATSLALPLCTAIRSGQEQMLDRWASHRHQVARDVVRMTDRMTKAATMRSRPARAIRNAALAAVGSLPGVRTAIARRLAELDNGRP